MNRFAAFMMILFVGLLVGSCAVFTFKECGMGALAYKNPTIAAMTGQCK